MTLPMSRREFDSHHPLHLELNYKTGELKSIPVHHNAVIAQLVECHLAKVKVAGSSPVYRSIYP